MSVTSAVDSLGELIRDMTDELRKANAYKELELLMQIENAEYEPYYQNRLMDAMEAIRRGNTENLLWPTRNRQDSHTPVHHGEGALAGSEA